MHTMTKASKEKRYNGKCSCGARFSTLATQVQFASGIIGPDAVEGSDRFVQFETSDRTFSPSRNFSEALRYRCACGKWNAAKPVRGIVRPEKKCNALCLASSGHSCECSCGGKNHGAHA